MNILEDIIFKSSDSSGGPVPPGPNPSPTKPPGPGPNPSPTKPPAPLCSGSASHDAAGYPVEHLHLY